MGLMTTIGGLVALGMQPAAGAVIDATHAKRGALILALSAMALGALVIFSLPTFCFRSRSTSSRSTGISLSFAVLHVINVGSASAIHPKQRGRHLAGIAPRSHRRYG